MIFFYKGVIECCHTHVAYIYLLLEWIAFLTWSYNSKGPVGITTLIFHTTTVPEFQDFSPEGFHGEKKERSEVYSVISAMNWSEIKLGDSVTWNASDRIFGDSAIENKFSREEWQPCFEFT